MTVRTSDIHIDPKLVRGAAARPKMLELRKAVKERFRVSDERARSFAERVLNDAVERFGVKYLNEMTAHIEQAFELREQAANIIDQVIGPQAMSPDTAATRLEGLFHDMKSHIESITGPESFAKSQPDKVLEDIAFPSDQDLTPEGFAREKKLKAEKVPRKALRTGRHTERLDLLARRFKLLAKDEHAALARIAEVAPHDLWKAVSSEVAPSLDSRIAALLKRARDEGMGPSEVAALEKAVRAMNEERRQQLARDSSKSKPRAARDAGSRLTTDQSEFLDHLLKDAESRGFETSNIDELHKALNGTDEAGRWEMLRSWQRDVQARALHSAETRRGAFFPDELEPGFAADDGLDSIENEGMVTREGAERVGAIAGRDYAERKLKLREADWINPFESRRSRFGTGFDDVMIDGQGNYWIVEYKGGTARLEGDQMQPSWVRRKLRQYRKDGGPLGKLWADRLEAALKQGRLRGVALKTEIVGRTAQSTRVTRRWTY